MDQYVSDIFLDLREKIELAKQKGSNMVVFTFAGSGCTHYLKEISTGDQSLTYINKPNAILGAYNLIDLPFEEALSYVKSVDVRQKYLIVISSGHDYHSNLFKDIRDHLYISFPLRSGSVDDISDMISRSGRQPDPEFTNLIMRLSGGIPKLAKYLIVHDGLIDEKDNSFQVLMDNIVTSQSGYDPSELKLLSLVNEDGEYLSGLLGKYIKNVLDIKVNFDLSFEEKGAKSKEKLTPLESKIIHKMLENDGKISKEDISDIKWGSGKYDEFSDQAINKQMRRLSQKLHKFTITTIPKVGFELK